MPYTKGLKYQARVAKFRCFSVEPEKGYQFVIIIIIIRIVRLYVLCVHNLYNIYIHTYIYICMYFERSVIEVLGPGLQQGQTPNPGTDASLWAQGNVKHKHIKGTAAMTADVVGSLTGAGAMERGFARLALRSAEV